MLIVLLVCCQSVQAQVLLNKTIVIDVRQQRLDNVLEIISNKGNFYFSYSSSIIKKDSLVSLSGTKTVKQILEQLFPDYYEFRESGNYIIIRKQPIKLTVVTNKAATDDKFYVVSGYVMDEHTAHWIENATVYEKSLLASTMTNANGYFKLKLKQKGRGASLTVSKEFYEDTTSFQSGVSSQTNSLER